MEYNFFKYEGNEYCSISTDKSTSNGILRFSHEISVTLKKQDDKWKFESAWHIGVSDMEWDSDEEESFEQTFPGLLAEMRKGIVRSILENLVGKSDSPLHMGRM